MKKTLAQLKNKTVFIIISNVIYAALGVLAFLLIWCIAAKSYGLERILPSPVSALKRMGELFADSSFWIRVFNSFVRTFIAFVISFSSALALALLCENNVAKKILAPIMSIIRAVPTMVLIVLFLFWSNARATPVLVVITVLFPTFYSAFSVVISRTDKAIIDSLKVMGANKLQIVYYAQLPLLSKCMIENTASGISLGFKLVVSAELIAKTRNSIGQFMELAQLNAQIDLLMGSALIVCLICIVVELLLNLPLIKLKYL